MMLLRFLLPLPLTEATTGPLRGAYRIYIYIYNRNSGIGLERFLTFICRIISATLIPLTIAPFASGSVSPVLDAVLCGALVIHSHIGFQ